MGTTAMQREDRTTHGVVRVAAGKAEERLFHDAERERPPHARLNRAPVYVRKGVLTASP